MSGDHIHGDVVNMHGGSNNQGIVHHHAPEPGDRSGSAELAAAVRALVVLLTELRDGVAPLDAASIDEALPAIAAGRGAAPQERHRALMAVAGIAATVGAVGAPVVDAVRRVLDLLGAQ
ncbi:hypothetical protein ACFVVX_22230 [Kitasatospora sp. NPDC058170]|uniref:hypothetical protein n=1 Tax=Kitasatospora sp. NPDC058170 TaxID=3346364 RepID=UPI0036DEF505